MAVSTPPSAGGTEPQRLARDHRFHPLKVREVIRETADSCSLVLEIPDELADAFAYRAGQFVTFRLRLNGVQQLRSYSMSSSPDVDDDFRVTVKRVPGGAVSTWLVGSVRPGDSLDATCPAGVFCLPPAHREVVAFAGGSGITPILALVKSALATTTRSVRLLYANRDADSVIFAGELDALRRRHPDRFEVVYHLDSDAGLLDAEAVRAHVAATDDADFFLCGPGPFMALIEAALLERQVDAGRIHIERFTPPRDDAAEDLPAGGAGGDGSAPEVTIELDGRTETTRHHPGTTLLQTARQAGLQPPSSCENGDCATCMARLVQGTVKMRANNALTDDEVAEGWVLTCQAVPDGPSVHVVYDYAD